ncbi:MarR family winged helix-turn-helix transcriptional regulator [Eremococcus coleocola]|uniref:MarR family winged helix-turn-helix transcriptional regulator n=1 Tax=Eremococcus coleocola TaxID=88132 RepID=UPI0003F8D790|nr:MarR family winged helix-turn-helix transcriptional regulator [Eremococcus coleocola]
MSQLQNGGYIIHNIKLLNGRLYNKLLSQEKDILFTAEQNKLLAVLYEKGDQTGTDLALATGLATNTASIMLKKLESLGLVDCRAHAQDQRKKVFFLTDLGRQQEEIALHISEELDQVFYQGFLPAEIKEFEAYLQRIQHNLAQKDY